jgi:hypothetical protein
MGQHMNEEYELKKFVKISAIVGGVWGFVNGLFLILSSIDSAPDTTFFGRSIFSYFFLPYVITARILATTAMQEIFSILNVGTNEAGGLFMNNIIVIPVMIIIPTLIGAIVIGGIALLLIITKDFV